MMYLLQLPQLKVAGVAYMCNMFSCESTMKQRSDTVVEKRILDGVNVNSEAHLGQLLTYSDPDDLGFVLV